MQEGKHVPDRWASSSKTSAPRDSKELEAWTGSGFAFLHLIEPKQICRCAILCRISRAAAHLLMSIDDVKRRFWRVLGFEGLLRSSGHLGWLLFCDLVLFHRSTSATCVFPLRTDPVPPPVGTGPGRGDVRRVRRASRCPPGAEAERTPQAPELWTLSRSPGIQETEPQVAGDMFFICSLVPKTSGLGGYRT